MADRGLKMDVSYHQWLLQDPERTDQLRRVVGALVRPGDVVADVGAGSGILAIWARRAGAARVYAVEASPIVRLAREMVHRNGIDGIVFLEGDGATIDLPEPVDVLVSECLGAFAFGDAMFRMVGDAARRWLKPGGRRAPQQVRLYLQPSDVKTAELRREFWCAPYDGLDLSAFLPGIDNRVAMTTAAAPFLLAEPRTVATFDPLDRPDEYHLEAEWTLPVGRLCTTLLGWFEVDWTAEVTQSTAPDAPPTHWGQAVFPLPVRETEEGDRLRVTLDVSLGDDDYARYRWSGAYRDRHGATVASFDRDTARLFGGPRSKDRP